MVFSKAVQKNKRFYSSSLATDGSSIRQSSSDLFEVNTNLRDECTGRSRDVLVYICNVLLISDK
ncbi:unnamed protein product [Rhodiola kirilowii]